MGLILGRVRPAVQPGRPVEGRKCGFDRASSVLKITDKGVTVRYWLARGDSQVGGELFHITKLDADDLPAEERYDVLIGSPADDGCSCPDGTFRGHRRPCKHWAAIHALIKEDRL